MNRSTDGSGPSSPSTRSRLEQQNSVKLARRTFALIREGLGDVLNVSVALVQELNRIAVDGIEPAPGDFRGDGEIDIIGSRHVPPKHDDVPRYVREMCDYLNRPLDAIHASAYAMWRVNWIHPFTDGNGRVSRALSYVVLNVRVGRMLPGESTIPDYIGEYKRRYERALEDADDNYSHGKVDLTELEVLLEELVVRQIEDAKRAAAGEYVEPPQPPGPAWNLD